MRALSEGAWRVGLAARFALQELVRRPLVLALLVAIPALFQAVVVSTTAAGRSDVMIAALHEEEALERSDNPMFVDLFDDGVRSFDRRAVGLVFLGLAAVGFLSAFVAFYVVHGRTRADERLVVVGFRARELALAKLLVVVAVILPLATYATGLAAWLGEARRPLALFAALSAGALTYGCIGLAVGAAVRHELQGILIIVLLANIDIGWLQNPTYYEESSGRWLIEVLPGFWPTQLALLAALTREPVGPAAARAGAVVLASVAIALVAVTLRVRLPSLRGEIGRRLVAAALAYALWLASFEAVGKFARTLDTFDLSLAIDTMIPFRPGWVWVYELTYLLPLAAVFAVEDAHRFNRALLAIGIASLGAYAVYVTLPVAFAWPPLGESLAEQVLAVERRCGFPPGANHLPSLHVTNAFLLYLAARGQRLGRLGDHAALALVLAIALSTLFVKQHIFIDVAGGTLWAFVVWRLTARVYPALIDADAPPAVALLQALTPRRWVRIVRGVDGTPKFKGAICWRP